MSGLLAGWTRQLLPLGAKLVSPQRDATLELWPRVSPVRRFGDVLTSLVASLPASAAPNVSRIRSSVSSSGDAVAAASVAYADASGAPMIVELACVYTETHMMVIDGRGKGAKMVDKVPLIVRACAHDAYLGLPAIRPRWYKYDPPPGWHGVRRYRLTLWYAPGFPREHAIIHAVDAVPIGHHPDPLALGMVRKTPPRNGTSVFTARSGLAGKVLPLAPYEIDGTSFTALEAHLEDKGFRYLLRLDCAPAAEERVVPVFLEMVASVEPVAMPFAAVAGGESSNDLWSE